MLLIINFIFYFQSGRSRGFAFVYFKNVDDAIEVMYRLRLQPLYYTPGIYADGYIVFAFPFVRSYVR